jgi:hypothetical protein
MNEEYYKFEQGLKTTLDPTNALIVQGGRGVTTLQSPWLYQSCSICSHTFRVDDEVAISQEGIIRHDSALLPCAAEKSLKLVQTQETGDFFRGLDEIWKPPQQLLIHRLEEGHPLLAPPYRHFKRHICAVCAHTLRPLDAVVICPCSPNEPRCQIAVHRDPAHYLYCWEDWKPTEYGLHCPATSRKL